MKIKAVAIAAWLGCLSMGAQAGLVSVGDSTDPWLGFLNVSELPANGGGFVFGSGWGTADLNSTFDDGANTLTLSPNTIGDANEFWYQNTSGTAPDPVNPGGPGQLGNKSIEANLYIENDALNDGSTLTFSGTVLANTWTPAHSTRVFVTEFVADYSSRTDSFMDITGTGAFSVSLPTSGTVGNHIQYGFQTVGENVWVTDTAPFGSLVVETIPEPATLGLIGVFGGALILFRRNFKA